MVRGRRQAFAGMIAGLAVVVAGCGGGGSDVGQQQSGGSEGSTEAEGGTTLTVLAASSLTDAFGDLEADFEDRNPGVDVRTSFAGSSDLLVQIEQGAPVDVFASASESTMEKAVEGGLMEAPEVFVKNRPVVIVPSDNPAGIEDFQDLAEAEGRFVLAQEDVPIAEYADEILSNADAEYGGGFRQGVLDKVVSREANVRASANRVALDEADATFVYASDVTEDIRDRVEVVEIPEDLNVVATYPISALKEAPNAELAGEWVELVLGEEGQRVLEENGFEPAG